MGKLFAEADGYMGTELLCSTEAGHEPTFLTIDRWKSAKDFAHFHKQFALNIGRSTRNSKA